MVKIIKLLQSQPLTVKGVILLVVTYLLSRDIFPSIPYINILTGDISGKLVLLWTIMLLLVKPSINALIALIILVLSLNLIIALLSTNGSEESFGLIIYTSLLFLAFKFIRRADN